MRKRSISVVIPTNNAGPEFDRVLAALSRQEVEPTPEILVVDSGSNDETMEICRQYPVRMERIDPQDFAHGRTRNLGVRHTRGEIICLLTQDALPVDTKLLWHLSRQFERDDVAGVVGRQIPRPDASPLTTRDVNRWILGSPVPRVSRISSQNEFEALSPLKKYLFSVFDNVCSAIIRTVWERIPFPDVLFGEDLEWGYRVLRCGYSIVYEPQAAVYHSHDRSISYQFRRMMIDHYRLRELFGLETIPTPLHIPGSILRQSVGDVCDLSRADVSIGVRLKEVLKTPARSTAHVLGQYFGARAHRTGRAAEELTVV